MTDKVTWQSVKWPDGSTYEGLVKGDLCHVRGVFRYSSGDRYEGEYLDNRMDGFGVYVWRDGTIYRGQWQKSMMHGCGVKISKQPNGDFIAEEGQFVNDEWVGDVLACTVEQARAAAAESDMAAQMARVFELSNDRAGSSRAASAASLTHSSARRAGGGRRPGSSQQAPQADLQQGTAASPPGEGKRRRRGPLGFVARLLGW